MLYLDCGLLVRVADLYRPYTDQKIDERVSYSREDVNLLHLETCMSNTGPAEGCWRPDVAGLLIKAETALWLAIVSESSAWACGRPRYYSPSGRLLEGRTAMCGRRRGNKSVVRIMITNVTRTW